MFNLGGGKPGGFGRSQQYPWRMGAPMFRPGGPDATPAIPAAPATPPMGGDTRGAMPATPVPAAPPPPAAMPATLSPDQIRPGGGGMPVALGQMLQQPIGGIVPGGPNDTISGTPGFMTPGTVPIQNGIVPGGPNDTISGLPYFRQPAPGSPMDQISGIGSGVGGNYY